MSEIISTIALVGLSVASLAALGWFAMPRPERVSPTQVGLRDWAGIAAHGARILGSWGPRLDFSTVPTAGRAEVRSLQSCER
jgi:hypothetical protein